MQGCRARRLDAEANREAKEKKIIRNIDAEVRRRKGMDCGYLSTSSTQYLAHGNSILDIPASEPWQATALNQLGEIHDPRKPWTCSRCGYRKMGGFPPTKCPCCGSLSPIFRLNLRR